MYPLQTMKSNVISHFGDCLWQNKFPCSAGSQLEHSSHLKLKPNEQMRFELSFCSDKPVAVEAKLTVKVEDNQYNPGIRVTGEAYWKIFSLNNITTSTTSLLDGSQKDKGMKIRMSIQLISESVV